MKNIINKRKGSRIPIKVCDLKNLVSRSSRKIHSSIMLMIHVLHIRPIIVVLLDMDIRM